MNGFIRGAQGWVEGDTSPWEAPGAAPTCSFHSLSTSALSCGGDGRGRPPGHSALPRTVSGVVCGHQPPWHGPGGGGGGRDLLLVPPGLGEGPTEPRRLWRRPLHLVPPFQRCHSLVAPWPACWDKEVKLARKGHSASGLLNIPPPQGNPTPSGCRNPGEPSPSPPGGCSWDLWNKWANLAT